MNAATKMPALRPEVQAAYLARARGQVIHVRLMSGEKLAGTLLGFDQYTLLLQVETVGAVMLNKHATAYVIAPANAPGDTVSAPGGDDWLHRQVGNAVRVQFLDGRAICGTLREVGRFDLLLDIQGRALLVRLAAVATVRPDVGSRPVVVEVAG